jgi:hypothetical protein
MFELVIKNIRRGKISEGRYNFIYAELWRMPTLQNVGGVPELAISATLDYITKQLQFPENYLEDKKLN